MNALRLSSAGWRMTGESRMVSAFHGSDPTIHPKLPYQKGCRLGLTIRQLFEGGWNDCYDLSAGQRKILEILNRKNEFRDVISVSFPSFKTWKHYEHGAHTAPGTDMDFVVLNQGVATHHPALMRAFQWLASAEAKSAGFVGGVGIGIINADPHLHVDVRHPSTLRWVEVDQTRGHEIIEGSENWPLFYLLAKNTYNWSSDSPAVSEFVPGAEPGGWPLLPLALGAAGAAIGLSKDYLHAGAYGVGGLALGYVVHSIMKKLGADMEK